MAAFSSEKKVVVIGLDNSDKSMYALEWTLDHFFPSSIFRLVLVHSRPTAISLVGDSDLRKIETRVLESAIQLCIEKSVDDVTEEVVEGDPRNVLCNVVKKYHAAVLVLGSHGYGAIRRVVLGTVSDYCVHHAHCNVMIVKKPKVKH